MNIRNLLLAGTAASALAAPITLAHAQSAVRLQTAQIELPAQCEGLEAEELEACLQALEAEGQDGLLLPPQDEGEEEPAPDDAEEREQGDTPEMFDEAPAEDDVAPEPEPEPEAVPEPEPEPEAQPEPAQDQEEEPALLLPEVVEPEPEPEPAEEAPSPRERPESLEAPADDTIAPEEMFEAEPEQPVEEPAADEVPQGLSAAARNYEAAATDFRAAAESGVEVAAARDALLAAEAELADVCAAIGQSDLEACLATFGIGIDVIPPEQIEAATDADEPEAAPEAEADAGLEAEEPSVDEGEDVPPDEGILGEVLPEGAEADADAVAPLLDSAKDALTQQGDDDGVQLLPEPEAAAEPAPAPESDTDAQAPVRLLDDIQPITAEEGTRREAPVVVESDDRDGEVVGRVETDRPQNLNVIQQLGLSLVFEFNDRLYIDTPDTDRLNYEDDREYYVEDLSDGRTREVILRADGSRIVTVRDRYGEIVRRSRIQPDGTEILLVYVDESFDRYDEQGRWIDPGSQLPPLRLAIPPQDYVLDASNADAARVETFLDQPPVEQIQRYYTLDEVKRSSRVRDMVRRLEIGDLTFQTDSAAIPPDQVDALSAVANAMLDLLAQNPAETFLIEGHTDAVGSDLYNLELSDHRAESVAYALTRVYGIPAENLATQGYGERYLKVNTPFDERVNRRVTIRRITPLITPVAAASAG